jgi:hypothetical protein
MCLNEYSMPPDISRSTTIQYLKSRFRRFENTIKISSA